MRDHAFYRHTPALLQAVDSNGLLIEVSDRWLQWLGYERHKVIGSHFEEFLSEETRLRVHALMIPDLLKSSEVSDFEGEYRHADGSIRFVLISATAVRNDRDRLDHALLVLTDISERKQAERLLLTISEGTANIAGVDYFRTLASHLAKVFNVRYALVTECTDRSMTRVRTLAHVDNHDVLENVEYDLAGAPCEGVVAGSVCHYPEKLGSLFPREKGVDSYLGVPMHDSRGSVIGHLAILDDKPFQAKQSEVAIMQIFAARAAVELERQNALDGLQQQERELRQLNALLTDYSHRLEQQVQDRTHEIEQRSRVAESLQDLLSTLNSNRAPGEILQQILSLASNLLGTTHSALFHLDRQSQMLAVQASLGLPDLYAEGLRFSVEHSFMGQAVMTLQPVVIHNLAAALQNDSALDLSLQRRKILAGLFQTLFAVPLVRKGQTDEIYGGIALYFPEMRNFSDEEVQLAVAFAGQASLVLENARLHQRLEQVAVMEERTRLAHELHDSVTQSLYSLTLLAAGHRRMAQQSQLENADEAFAELGEIGKQALSEMRQLIYELRPPQLEEQGLWGALNQRLMAVERRSGIEARLIADQMLDLPPNLEDGLYRIAQEALNNVLKHAAASHVEIRLEVRDGLLRLIVEDNGKGFDSANCKEGGIGLGSMSERAKKLGGRFVIHSVPGSTGTQVCVEVPVQMNLASTGEDKR